MAKTKIPDGRRIAMAERQVQEVIARYLLRDLKDELPGFVTVSRVTMPADLRTARVYVSVLAPGEDESKLKEEVARFLQKMAAHIQDELASQLQMRYCPKLSFYADETTERVLKIEGMLNQISGKKKTPEDADE